MRILTLIGLLLIISLVITGCAKTAIDSEESQSENLNLEVEEDSNLESTDLDSMDSEMNELENLL